MATVKTKTSNHQIFEVISTSAKTSVVKEITTYGGKNTRVKNADLVEDTFIQLDENTAKTAKLILNINSPEWGVNI